MLIKAGISNKVDDTGVTVGKRYARTDECGIPFAITVDFDTLKDETVTLRDLDSMKQIRLPISDLTELVNDLITGYSQWSEAVAKFGLYSSTEMTEEELEKKAAEKPAKNEPAVKKDKSVKKEQPVTVMKQSSSKLNPIEEALDG